MAGGALDAVGLTLGELSIVVVFVAVSALGEREFFLEVTLQVAGLALHRLVFPHQRILRLGVIEVVIQAGVRNSLPATRVMARGARLVPETSLVRIGMAVVAFPERQTSVSGSAARIRSVALLALHLLVQTGQRITRFAVIKLSFCILPINEVMALEAILAESSFMEVFVTRSTGLRDPQEGLAEILHLDVRTLGGRNLFG